MLNRPTAQAESRDLSRGLQTKVTRRPWNAALHPRDSKGRFIETGGTVRLWGGKLARVVRALPHDRILVQDKTPDGTFTGRRHTTSAKWVTMVARPDGSAPTNNEDKVAEEDSRRYDDPRRGLGISRDDQGDPDTPDDPHNVDDQGNAIGDDEGDGPDVGDDQDEPGDGKHPIKLDALPNRKTALNARYADTAAVRQHFTNLADQPETTPDMADALRHMAQDEDLRITPSSGLAIRPDDANGRWYLTATGTGQRLTDVGDFETAQDAERFADHLNESVRNGHIMPGEFNQPFDFSDPNLDQAAKNWASTKGENVRAAIIRARKEFDATPAAEPRNATAAPQGNGRRFSSLQEVRAHWAALRDQEGGRGDGQAQVLDALINDNRLKLVGQGQLVTRRNPDGKWKLIATGSAAELHPEFESLPEAQQFGRLLVASNIKGQDGKPLDLSTPEITRWRSENNQSLPDVVDQVLAKWKQEHGADPAAGPDVQTPTSDVTQQAPEVAPEQPQPEPSPLPDGAEPVDGVDGYHYTNDGGSVTVYGPDGQAAATSQRGFPPQATVNGVKFPVPSYPPAGAAVMARAHRASQLPPEERDHVTAEWITFKGKRVMAFHGTIRGDENDRAAIGSVKAVNRAPSVDPDTWLTMSTMGPSKRDEKIAEVLQNLDRQGRYVVISDGTAKPATADGANAPAAPVDEAEAFQQTIRDASDVELRQMENERWAKQSRIRSESGRRNNQREINALSEERKRRQQEREQAVLRDVTSLSDEDIQARVRQSQEERGTYGSRRGQEANDVDRAVYGERRRRSQAMADDQTDLTGLIDEELAQAREKVGERVRLHQAAGDDPTAERTMRQALQTRHDSIVGEQQRRRAVSIASRPPAADLDDEQLAAEYDDLISRDLGKASPEAQEVLKGRLEDIKRERRDREKRAITDREAPDAVSSEELGNEYAELERGRTSYEADEVTAARKQRMAAIEAELSRRDTTPEVEQLLARVDNPDSNGGISVDGGAPYGYIDHNAHVGRREVGWSWGKNTWGHTQTYPSRAAALAALVRSYDTDDDRRGERTWGQERRVFVPKMFVELYQNGRLGDRLASATEERRYLYSLFRDRYGWDDGVNPLVPSSKKGHHIKGRNLVIPEGLLAEFNRITEELSRDMSVQATDREADSSDRQKAKTRLASINVALHAIETAREAVRQNGGNDDQKVISREEIEAQQAALRAALGGNDDEHVQPDGPGALADVPAAGVGGDGRSGSVRDGEGQGDRGADSGGRGGAGEDGAGAAGVRGGGRPAEADQGGRDGDGSAGASAGAGARGGDSAGADAGDAAPAGDQGRDVRPVARFRPDPANAPKGTRARAVANVEAIKVLKKLETENRPATDEEKRILARWSGWGSAPVIFASEPNEKEPRYQQGGAREGKFEQDHARWAEYSDVRDELQRVLTPLEFRQASRGVLSMHYTPQPIAEAMWDGLRAFGFERGDVLEAGSGAGTFFGVAPDGARLTGVELDPTTARIAQVIYPEANVLNESFAETDAHPGTFDAAIGNVPFARVPFDDKRYPAENLHNGFVTKEIALVRPGGITAVITSRQTLDSKGDKARRQMAKYGDLVGAVRLPSGVFNDAGTGVTTDVLVFRRREDGTEAADTSWLDAPERDINGTKHHINAYFDEHPEHVLGTMTTKSGPFGPEVTVQGDAAKAAEQLRSALEGIAAKATADGRGYEPNPAGDDRPPVRLQAAREKHANDWTGRVYEGDDGQFYQHVNGAEPVRIEPADGNTAQLRALLGLRDVAAELRELDRKNDEEERADALRAQLRDLHAAYVAEYGPLSKPGQHRTKGGVPTALGYFRADPDAAAVNALERWDAGKGEVLSRIFTERAAARRQPLTSTDDPKTALAAVVAATGDVDLGEISRLLNLDPQETLRRLGTEVFTNPGTGRLELASAYLSGAVRDKLEAARKAAETDPSFAVNVASLEAVQPPERTIGQFTPEMAAHWTPPELLQGFLREYLGDRTLRVAHDDRYGWVLNTGKVPEANNIMYGVPADPEKGTRGKSAVDIARAVLGFGSLTVYHDEKRKDVDETTSRLIRQKADQMRAEFAKYSTANAERLTTLTESYNRIMNGHVVRSYEGMSPSLEGFTPDREPHPWQRSGAARMQFERGVILAHEVGLGKTSTLVMGTQALKASGQIEKPMAVVPNHLAKQWADEAGYLYPNADIHLITSADLADGRRASTLEWLRANKPDLVIFTEEAFGSIRMSPEAQEAYEFRELEALRAQLDRQYEDADNPSHPFIVAKIEQRIATVQRNINKNAAPMRKPGETYWDDLGFDYFVVDEAHRYKGVGFRSKEGGGDPASIRGIDLHQKTTDLHQRRSGRATITLATGTPLSNSISEQFTMLQFAAPWVLDAYKAGAPDLWAATFGRKTLRIENAPDGSGLRVVERFSEFHNKRAMKTMWGLVADTKRGDDVGIPRPKLKGNAPNLIMVDATSDQKKRLKGLVARGRAIHNGEVDRSQDNMLAVSGEGTSVALDPRLIDANAPAGNKLKAVADRHIERYHQTKDRVYKVAYGSDEDHPVPGALQMIFLNEGVPGGKNKGGFDAYAELKRLMVAGGIPEDKIKFVQDAKKSGKPEDMTELFRRAREGEISVLMGSSAVAGTGMNAQDRMISLSHVDLDWGAAQMEQRNGRILRYGNMNPEVEIDIYATKGSMDGWKSGFVAAKAEGLVDIQRPEPEDGDTSDTVSEIDGAEFDYETMEAEIGGNPYMSQLMKARRTLKDLEIDQHNEAAERIRRSEALDALRQEAEATREGIQRREQALPRIRDLRGNFAMTIGGSPYGDRADAGAALHRQVTTRLLEHDREGMSPWHILGQFGGLDFGVRTERDADGKLTAHVGFPELRHSDFERSVEDLKKKGAGSGMITRLSNALAKAPALQESDRAKVPELNEQIALLQSAHAAADLTPQIDHARNRSHLLEEIVGRVTDLDAKPEIDPDELDKKRFNKADREKIAAARREERIPLQVAVDQAAAKLKQWDQDNPAPESAEPVRLSEEEVRDTLARIRPEGQTGPAADTTAPEASTPETDAPAANAPETNAPETAAAGNGGAGEPPTDAPSTATPDEPNGQDDTQQPTAADDGQTYEPFHTSEDIDQAVGEIRDAVREWTATGLRNDLLIRPRETEGHQRAAIVNNLFGQPISDVKRPKTSEIRQALEAVDGILAEIAETPGIDPYGRAKPILEDLRAKMHTTLERARETRRQKRERQSGAANTGQGVPPTDAPNTTSPDAPNGPEATAEPTGPVSDREPFKFRDRVTDPDGQGWYVSSEDEDGTVIVNRDGATATFHRDELTREPARQDEQQSTEPDSEEQTQPETSGAASTDEQTAAADDETAPAGDPEQEPDTVTLDPDEVAAQLDAIRPEGLKAPSAMTEQELSDEMVALMEREMADGDLSGADRTRMAVLEAETDRRAGRTPKPQPKPQPAEPAGGLFDLESGDETPAAVADPDNPLDRPDDEFGTPDMFAASEGRDTSRLRPVQMRNAADLEAGERYTDADGRTHTVAEKPVRTGRGRTRVVTDDGRERFYTSDTELRVRYPDEDIPENEEEGAEPDSADTPADGGTTNTADGTGAGETVQDPVSTPETTDRTDVTDRTRRMSSMVGDALDIVGGDSLPEMQDLADAIDRAETADDPEETLRDVADRLDSLAQRYEAAGPQGERAARLFRRAARVARNEDEDDTASSDEETTPSEPTPEEEPQRDGGDNENGGNANRRRRDGDTGGPDSDGAGPDGGSGAPGMPDSPSPDAGSNEDGQGDQANQRNDDNDRRRRRRRNRGGDGAPGGAGGPGAPGLPRIGFPLGDGSPATGTGSGDGRRGGDAASDPRRNIDALRDAWNRGEGLTPDEDTPERRAFLAELANWPSLTLSEGGGIVTWPEEQEDGSVLWRFAMARNGARLPDLGLDTDSREEARDLASRFEAISDSAGQPFDWHRPWGPSSIAQWRDGNGRNLRDALRAANDDFEQQRTAAPTNDGEAAQPDQASITLPEDLSQISNDDLDALVSQPLSGDDMMRVMAEMDRRDDTDQRVRDAIPDTPPTNAEEEAQRGRAMDEALAFGDTDITGPSRNSEEQIRTDFATADEARFLAAEDATGGRMLSPAGEQAGVSARDVFSGSNMSQRSQWRRYASPELLEWFDSNGGRLTYSTFKARRLEEGLQHQFVVADEARFLAAEDATRGVFLNRDGEAAGINDRELFSGGSLSQFGRWRRYVSDELLEWFDNNGGRLTYNQYKLQARENERAARDEYEAEQRAAAGNGETSTPQGADAAAPTDANGDVSLDSIAATGWTGVVDRYRALEEAARAAYGDNSEQALGSVAAEMRGAEAANAAGDTEAFGRHLYVAASRARLGTSQEGSEPEELLAARRALSVEAHNTAIRNLTPPGEGEHLTPHRSLKQGDIIRRPFRDEYSVVLSDPTDRTQGDEVWLDGWSLDAADTGFFGFEPGDYLVLQSDDPDRISAGRRVVAEKERQRATAQARSESAQRGAQNRMQAAAAARSAESEQDQQPSTPEPQSATADTTSTGADAVDERPATPEPVNGQPAHWARVGELAAGDMARIEGTTKRGRNVTRAGYVLNAPVQVSVTRRGRAETMWRTSVGESPDGRGERGNVFTPLNATAARAETPDNTVPGSPASGAQGDVIRGNLPDTIPTDGNGRGLFPGSSVTGSGNREGTVTGATDTTVSVRWADGNSDTGITPTSLTVNDGERPDGWTAAGQRVRPGHIVTDENGALLGPVDEVNGDQITVTTAGGTITRSAADLRVAGEVRDDAPGDTEPVTGIDTPTAGDLTDGDVVVLDLDGTLTTVQVISTPSRDGDRVTIEYADTTNGEIGELELDATATVPRAEGPDGAPQLSPADAPDRDDELTVHEPAPVIDPVTGPTVDPDLTPADRDAIDDHGSAPEDDPDAQQAAARIDANLPVTPDQAAALAAQLRDSADPSTTEGRAALRAADHLDQAAGLTPPAGLDRPRPSNAAQIGEGDLIAMPDERRGDEVRVFRVIDTEDGPGGVRSLLLEDEDQQWRRRIVHGAMPVWQLPEPRPDAPTPPDLDDPEPTPDPATPIPTPAAPATPDPDPDPIPAPATPAPAPQAPVARVRPGSLRVGDVIDAPVSRTGYQFNGHRRLTIITPPQRNGWWMALTGVDDDGNVHDFGLHSGRDVNVYERNRPTPALPPSGAPRDPNPSPLSAADQIVADHARTVAARIIDEAIAGTQTPGDIHALREQIAQRLTPEALREARQAARDAANNALDAMGVTGPDRARAQQALKQARQDAHAATVRAALRTINDLEPLPDESDEDLAQRAADLLRLIPDQIATPARTGTGSGDADGDIMRAVAGHTDEAVAALLQQLQAAGLNAGDAQQVGRLLAGHLNGSRQATARRIAQRVAATSPAAGRQPGLLARIIALLIRLGRRLVELVKAAASKIAEKWQNGRERLARLRAFLGRLATRVRQWPESRRLARLQAALDLPSVDGESLGARVAHWAGLMPEPGRFGQASRRVTWWRPTTWGQLAAGRLPGRSDRMQWSPDRAADGGPGLTTLRHLAALRAAGGDVDQDVTRRLAAALGDDFGGDPHGTMQRADDHVATTERRLVNLQAAQTTSTIQDPDVEVELAAARLEASTARREWADLRARYAAAVPDAVAAALTEIRDIGPEGNAGLVFTPDSTPDAERSVRGVQRLLPRSWLNIPAGRRLTAVDGEEGRYEPELQRATIADLADDGLGTAGHALAQHFAQHVPDLDAAQRAFWFTRTHTGRPGARRMNRSALGRLLSRQQTQPETGDSLARSVQSMFSGDWYEDDDLRAFLLGLLATR
ncbi:hypothetical protein [Streptomyces sp. NPDC000880]